MRRHRWIVVVVVLSCLLLSCARTQTVDPIPYSTGFDENEFIVLRAQTTDSLGTLCEARDEFDQNGKLVSRGRWRPTPLQLFPIGPPGSGLNVVLEEPHDQ